MKQPDYFCQAEDYRNVQKGILIFQKEIKVRSMRSGKYIVELNVDSGMGKTVTTYKVVQHLKNIGIVKHQYEKLYGETD